MATQTLYDPYIRQLFARHTQLVTEAAQIEAEICLHAAGAVHTKRRRRHTLTPSTEVEQELLTPALSVTQQTPIKPKSRREKVFNAVRDAGKPMRNPDVCKALPGFPTGTISSTLSWLKTEGYLLHDEETGYYTVAER